MGELPVFPDQPPLSRDSFSGVLLCWFIHRIQPGRPFSISLRDLAAQFNRMSPDSLSKQLQHLAAAGWLQIDRVIERDEPNRYRLGPAFTSRPSDAAGWRRTSAILFGPDGLLEDWVPPAAWGRDCVGTNALLVIGVIRYAGRPVTRRELTECLDRWMTERTFDNVIGDLTTIPPLLLRDGASLLLATDWEAELDHWVEATPAGEKKLARRRTKTALEREAVRRSFAAGRLLPAERRKLKAQPCIFCGRRFPPSTMVQEHWPPQKYLKQFLDGDSRHFLFPICADDNGRLGQFIRDYLPAKIEPVQSLLQLPLQGAAVHTCHSSSISRDDSNGLGNTVKDSLSKAARRLARKVPGSSQAVAIRTYRALSELSLQRFYAAFRNGDVDAATREVEWTLGAWMARAEHHGLQRDIRAVDPPPQRTQRGSKAPRRYWRPG